MRLARGRLPVVPILVGIVMLLVPTLAWLQYQWVGQISEAERDRMQRTLKTAASQFAIEFDSELSKALVSLQVEGPALLQENWTNYAQRYSSWNDAVGDAKIVRDVLLVDTGNTADINTASGRRQTADSQRQTADSQQQTAGGRRQTTGGAGQAADKTAATETHALGVFEYHFTPGIPPPAVPFVDDNRPVTPEQLRLRRWNPSTLTFDAVDWPADVLPFRAMLAQRLGEIKVARGRSGGGSPRDVSASFSVGDDNILIAPVTLFEPPPAHDGPPAIAVLGFTLIRLDPVVIHDTVLPALAARHLHGEDGRADYRVAVVSRTDPSRVIWESEPGAARLIGGEPDVSQDLMAARPDRMFVFARNQSPNRSNDATTLPTENIVVSMIERRDTPGAARTTVRGRAFGPFEGRWTLLAIHRAGSLEAAVAAVRKRNLVLSSSILLLLTLAVGLIVVSARRAQSLARQQMEFVAAVSHELRTPVSVIGAAAGNLADGVVGDPQRVRKYGETIQGEARRLGETVERVLQLAGIAAGRAAAAPTSVSPSELVLQSIRACQADLDAAGAEVEIDIVPDLPMVQGDVVALRSALQNLISNAIKYGGDARWLRVSVARNELPGARSVVFRVEDHGLGIDTEDRTHIFEPFYRGREAVSRQIHGSGLGLNLVKRIAEAHGGSVGVTSEPGQGSTFTLTLPALATEATVMNVATANAQNP